MRRPDLLLALELGQDDVPEEGEVRRTRGEEVQVEFTNSLHDPVAVDCLCRRGVAVEVCAVEGFAEVTQVRQPLRRPQKLDHFRPRFAEVVQETLAERPEVREEPIVP